MTQKHLPFNHQTPEVHLFTIAKVFINWVNAGSKTERSVYINWKAFLIQTSRPELIGEASTPATILLCEKGRRGSAKVDAPENLIESPPKVGEESSDVLVIYFSEAGAALPNFSIACERNFAEPTLEGHLVS